LNLLPGQILADKYRIIRQIGQGGMGAVFEGENARIRRRVAIKTLHAAVSTKSDVIQRFEREAQAAGRIGSEHIVEVLDMGELPDQSRFMVMEFLEGQTLGERIVKQGRIPPRDVIPIMDQLLLGLEAAHKAEIIHRDLKPANIFLSAGRGPRADFVKILDFGVSKFNVLNNEEMSMTRTGAVVGTPYYMSPEQAKGARNIDQRADIYSVGVILYEAITGQVPFNAETFNELIFKIALESPPPPEQFVPNLDPAFSGIMKRAMAREVDARFQSAGELRDALLGWARGAAPGVAPQSTVALAMPPGAAQGQGAFGTIALDAPPLAAPRQLLSGGTVAMGPGPTPRAGAPSGLPATPARNAGGPLSGTIAIVASRPSLAAFALVALLGLVVGGGLYIVFVFARPTARAATHDNHSSKDAKSVETVAEATTSVPAASTGSAASADSASADSAAADSAAADSAAPASSVLTIEDLPAAPTSTTPATGPGRSGLADRSPTTPTANGAPTTATPPATAAAPPPTGRAIDDSL